MERLEQTDREIADLIRAEHRRQNETLELIASENHVSIPVLKALGSVLTDKYAEGYPAKRCYEGCQKVDEIETVAITRAKELFGAEHANVQPHSGTSANLAVYLAAIKPGDKIMGMDLAHGGHLSHGMSINQSGKLYEIASYGVEEGSELLDLDAVREAVLRERPALLVAGASAYPRKIDFEAFGQIAREAGCLLMCDIAHIAGLVVTGNHPDPIPHADFATTTNHKTLRGPRGGIILCKAAHARSIDRAVFPGIQGGPLMHSIAAKAVSFREAMQPDFADYINRVLANAKTLAEELTGRGWRLISGGTDNHLLLIDLRSRLPELTGREAADRLARAGIVCNMNAIPFDPRPPLTASGIRLGTPAVTTRGLDQADIRRLADAIDRVLMSEEPAIVDDVRGLVAELCNAHPVPNHNLEED
jgi:glycine hydroxymethyltransferase